MGSVYEHGRHPTQIHPGRARWKLRIAFTSHPGHILPYLAASGHNMHTKSARVYLQQMTDLKAEHPDVQQRFDDWFHTIRRSDRQWVGLSSNLIIEQVMTRSLKSSAELTRGRGMTEHQRLVWLLSTPACV